MLSYNNHLILSILTFIISQNIVTLGRRLVREGDLEEVPRDGGKGSVWHLFLFNDLLLWARPIPTISTSSLVSSSSSVSVSTSLGRSPTASPRHPRGSWTSFGNSLFGSSEAALSRSAPLPAVTLQEGKYNVEMIDDLVHLSVSEVPVSHTHPDAEVSLPIIPTCYQ